MTEETTKLELTHDELKLLLPSIAADVTRIRRRMKMIRSSGPGYLGDTAPCPTWLVKQYEKLLQLQQKVFEAIHR